jgi:hypothetical protein
LRIFSFAIVALISRIIAMRESRPRCCGNRRTATGVKQTARWFEIIEAVIFKRCVMQSGVGNLLGVVLQSRHGEEGDTVVGAIVGRPMRRPGSGN